MWPEASHLCRDPLVVQETQTELVEDQHHPEPPEAPMAAIESVLDYSN
jgi:hypothetical protein